MASPKFRNPLAAAALLSLAAATALRLGLWREAGFEEMSIPEGVRRGRQLRSSWDDDLRKLQAGILVSRGLDPESREFQDMLDQRLKDFNKDLSKALVLERLDQSRETWLRGARVRKVEEGSIEGEVEAAASAASIFEEKRKLAVLEEDYDPLAVCGRPAAIGSTEDFTSPQKNMLCHEITKDKPILLLAGGAHGNGGTGNNLIKFLHAIQEARDNDVQLGIMAESWATNLLMELWMAAEDDGLASQIERAFCVKIFRNDSELEGWEVVDHGPEGLFKYKSELPLGEYMTSQQHSLRALFQGYNTGTGSFTRNGPAGDACSGIDAVFGGDGPDAIYSVVHVQSLVGEPGRGLLGSMSRRSGCDPEAALEMSPEYVKGILEPLGMMRYPLVFITDGRYPEALWKLQADPDLGPILRMVPEEARSLRGDLALGVMSNVFIGNPASWYAGFISKTRLALGFGHNYLFRARDEGGRWRTVCGDHCIFDKTIMGAMA